MLNERERVGMDAAATGEISAARRERPILFSAPMVRAILDGRKTQTRRAVKQRFDHDCKHEPRFFDTGDGWACAHCGHGLGSSCPYGAPGGRLWLRETFSDDWCDRGYPVQYRADGDLEIEMFDAGVKWRPSIHMPRALSRITLEITDVRVQRLQDITQADCRAEGCVGGHVPGYGYNATPREHFRQVWEAINGKDSYHANPWVWALTFRRVP